MRPRGIFITGTDTGVGKTVVTALLLAYLRQRGEHTVALKPVSSGDRSDARLLWDLADRELSLDEINPIHFRLPLAPLIAARLERKPWRLARLRSKIRNQKSKILLLEGVGGLLVPLAKDYTCRDLACDLKLPILIVARPNLGTINHTALTVEAARAAHLKVLGIVLNDARGGKRGLAEQTNAAAIEEACDVKVIAEIPHLPGLRPTANCIHKALARGPVRRAVADVAALL